MYLLNAVFSVTSRRLTRNSSNRDQFIQVSPTCSSAKQKVQLMSAISDPVIPLKVPSEVEMHGAIYFEFAPCTGDLEATQAFFPTNITDIYARLPELRSRCVLRADTFSDYI